MNKQLMRSARLAQGAFTATLIFSGLAGIVIIVQALLLSHTITRVHLGGATLDDVTPVLLALAGVVALRALFSALSAATAAQVSTRVRRDLRRRLIAHLTALGPSYLKNERSGELVTAATEGIEALDAYFKDYLPALFIAVIIPVMILLVVFPLDLLTFLVMLITAPLIPLFMVLIGMAAGAVARRQYAQMGRLGAHFLDVLQGLTTLRLFNRSRYQIASIARQSEQFRLATMRVLQIAFLSAFALELLATLSVAVVAVEIGIRLLYAHIGFEQALFLLIIAPEYYLPLRTLGMKFHAGTSGKAAAERIFSVLAQPVPSTGGTEPAPGGALSLRFDAVSVRYPAGNGDGERVALDGFSLDVPAGACVALVGESGAGKSTVADLILRFCSPSAGTITVNGVDLAALDADGWRARVAWVGQRPHLFSGSIADNIRMGDPNATPEQVIRAAQDAGAHEFIMRLPQGYDTPCGERGAHLSGGQAQRIAIARAFLRDAPLLVLDEATANLDPDTEAHVTAALARLIRGRTALVIAHRMNTIATADRIAVLAGGRVVQQGTHAQLLAQGGEYARLLKAFDPQAAISQTEDRIEGETEGEVSYA